MKVIKLAEAIRCVSFTKEERSLISLLLADCQAFFDGLPEGESISHLILRLNKLENDVDRIYLSKADTWTILGEVEAMLETTIDTLTRKTAEGISDKLSPLRFKQDDPEGRDFDRFANEEWTLTFDSEREDKQAKEDIEDYLAWVGGDYHVTESGEVWSLDNWQEAN